MNIRACVQELQEKSAGGNAHSLKDLATHCSGYSMCCGAQLAAVAIWRPRTGEVFRVETDEQRGDADHDSLLLVHDDASDADRLRASVAHAAKGADVTIEVWGAFLDDRNTAYVSVWHAPIIMISHVANSQQIPRGIDIDKDEAYGDSNPGIVESHEPVLFLSVPVTYPGKVALNGLPAGYTYYTKVSVGYALHEGTLPWETADGADAHSDAASSDRGSYRAVNFTVVAHTTSGDARGSTPVHGTCQGNVADSSENNADNICKGETDETQTEALSDRRGIWLRVGGYESLRTFAASYAKDGSQETVIRIPGSSSPVQIKWQDGNSDCQHMCR
jgi:hypothetical protein